MTVDMLSLLVLAAAAVRYKQHTAVAFITVVPVVLHEIGAPFVSGASYYVFAAVLGFWGVFALSSLPNPTTLVVRLQRVALASIAVNFAGWALWVAYLPPTLYNVVFVALYVWLLIELLRRDIRGVGVFPMGGGMSVFSVFNRAGGMAHGQHK